jgi:hypothetical protein
MATDLANKIQTKLHITTKIVGGDRIQKAKDNNEDIAVLSDILPGKNTFKCALNKDCLLGTPNSVVPGILLLYYFYIYINNSLFT